MPIRGRPYTEQYLDWVFGEGRHRARGLLVGGDATSNLINYPRVSSYTFVNGLGQPLASGGVIDDAMVAEYAKYDVLTLHGPALSATVHPGAVYPGLVLQIAQQLRALMRQRSGTILLSYQPTEKYFRSLQGQNVTDGPNRVHSGAVVPYDAILQGASGNYLGETLPGSYDAGWLDFSRAGFPEAMADIVFSLIDWNTFDGIFCDEAVAGISWSQALGDTINYAYSGFATFQEWDVAYQAGVVAYFQRLRHHLGYGKYICGNGGQLSPSFINGWMRENFPFQNGDPATWTTNMFGWVNGDVGYFGDCTGKTEPTLCWLSSWSEGLLDDATNQRKARYVLGSASLSNGVGNHNGSAGDLSIGLFLWVPEFSITPAGASDTTGNHRGWLGQPIEAAVNTGSGLWKREFQRGMVLVNTSTAPRTYNLSSPFIYAVSGTSANPQASVPASDARFLVRAG